MGPSWASVPLWEVVCAWSTMEHLLLLWPLCSLSCFSFFVPSSSLSFSALNCVFRKPPPMGLVGSALACGGPVLELAWTDYVWHRAAPDLFSQKPPLQPSLCWNLANYTKYIPKGQKSFAWALASTVIWHILKYPICPSGDSKYVTEPTEELLKQQLWVRALDAHV